MNAVALINPDNPSGSFILQKDMMRIIDECRKKDVLCIIDESFVDFADGDIRYTLLDDDLLQTYTNLLVIKSISKSYGVPGLRLGIARRQTQKYYKKCETRCRSGILIQWQNTFFKSMGYMQTIIWMPVIKLQKSGAA